MIARIALAAAVVAAFAGCSSEEPEAPAPQVTEKVFNLTPGTVKVKAGIVGGELSRLKVTERVEEGTGRIDYGPRLTGRLVLRNLSTDESVLIDGGKIVYADASGKPIEMPPEASAPSIRLSQSYGSTSTRLDPGQELVREVDVDFPADALAPGKLREIRVQLRYTAAPFRRDLLEFPVALSEETKEG
ncbi:MAG TPA: hypothetical protein VF211_14450 [Burkholderiales bacterium]